MSRATLRNGGAYPFWFEHLEWATIAAVNYDPITNLAANLRGTYSQSGFGVKNATENAGYIYAITWHQYKANNDTFAGIVPIRIDLAGYEWALTPLVKVYGDMDGTYASTVVNIQIGWIL